MILLICHVFGQCQPPPSIREQIERSQVVFEGRVVGPPVLDEDNLFSIELAKSVFYLGCGPSNNIVRGFSSAENCGIAPPSPGSFIIVFACKEGEGWRINGFQDLSGSVPRTTVNREEVRQLTSEYGSDCFDDRRCLE